MEFEELHKIIIKIDDGEESFDNIENKQHLSLSRHAHMIIEQDAEMFREEKSEESDDARLKYYTNFINKIISVYAEHADASISRVLKREKEDLKKELTPFNKEQLEKAKKIKPIDPLYEEQLEKAIALLSEKREFQLLEKAQTFIKRKGVDCIGGRKMPCKIRINRKNLRWLGSQGFSEKDFYNNNVGRYLKALVEEYADLSYVEREKIFYRSHIDSINSAKSDNVMLKITLHTKNRNSADGITRNNEIEMKPYCIATDFENMYNYVIGIKKNENAPQSDESRILSVRLSSIQKCECTRESAAIDKKEEKMIKDAIAEKGVQYLSAEENIREIVVKLDGTGEKMYNRMLHLRPMYVERNNGEYKFMCTETQAEFYFFKFGHHAKILKPENLAELFRRKYASAERQYEQSDVTNDSPKQ